MNSDDGLSSSASIPDEKTITEALRKAVQNQFEEDASKATVKAIRARVESELSLGNDFLKQDPFWRLESKHIIEDEANKQNLLREQPTSQREHTPEGQPPARVSRQPTKKRAPLLKKKGSELDDKALDPPKKSEKREKGVRTTAKYPAARKSRSRPTVVEDDEGPETRAEHQASGSDLPELDASPQRSMKRQKASPSKTSTPKKFKKTYNATPPEDGVKEIENGEPGPQVEASGAGEDSGNESEMSLVLDPTPQKKSRAQNSTAAPNKKPNNKGGKSRPKEKLKGSSKVETSLSPDEEQIKTLQGWLLKCGVRKFWSKELAKFDSPKEKINHLRGLLTDVGMTPRYSAEKAKKIKEDRELRAEVEAVQAGATEWGKGGNARVNTRSSRSVPTMPPEEKKKIRGMEDLAFLDDQSDSC